MIISNTYESLLKSVNKIHDIKSKNIALEFTDFLFKNRMMFEKAGGYWDKQSYWYVKYKNEFVCYILVNATGTKRNFILLLYGQMTPIRIGIVAVT